MDKTLFLKKVFESGDIALFTRPRHFGKTLLMDMFRCFLCINYKNPQDKEPILNLFKGTKILEDKSFVEEYMRQFPIISLSIKTALAVISNKLIKIPLTLSVIKLNN